MIADEGQFVVRLRRAGMFSNINEIVQQLHLAEKGSYRFSIDWTKSLYRVPSRPGDPWNYYFHDCFSDLPVPSDPTYLAGGNAVACTRDNIITPRQVDFQCDPLLLPADRSRPNRIIQLYLHLRSNIQDVIDRFVAENFGDEIIGLHIRGPGRKHGGVPVLRGRLGNEHTVPLNAYLDPVKALVKRRRDARVLLCTDSEQVARDVSDILGRLVLQYPAIRSEYGEMHLAGHPENRGIEFDRYRLGEDVIVEANLLARTNHFVHGNSNVSNFVLCANPDLEHTYVPA